MPPDLRPSRGSWPFRGGRAARAADVTVPPLAEVREDLRVAGFLRVGDGAVLHGSVEAVRGIRLGNRVRVKGPLESGGSLRVGRGALLEGGFTAHGDVRFGRGARVKPAPPPTAPAPPAPAPRRLVLSGVPLDVPTPHADALLAAFHAIGWRAEDTGRTVTTDEDEEGLATLVVDVLLPALSSPPSLPGAPGPSRPRREGPGVLRGVIYGDGDLHVGDGVDCDLALAASGDVVVGRGACVAGLIHAGGDLVLCDRATVGDALCGGELRLSEGATVGSVVQAGGGVVGERPRVPDPDPADEPRAALGEDPARV